MTALGQCPLRVCTCDRKPRLVITLSVTMKHAGIRDLANIKGQRNKQININATVSYYCIENLEYHGEEYNLKCEIYKSFGRITNTNI